MSVKASAEITLVRVDDGADGAPGDSGIIVSATAPESPKVGQLWQTAAGEPIKRWTGSGWVVHKMSVENLNVEKLSALSADLGNVTAGSVYGKKETNNETTEIDIDIDNGYITVTKLDEDNIHKTVIVKDGTMTAATQRFNGSARNGIRVEGEKIVSVRDYYNETTNQTFHHENTLFSVNNIAVSGGMITELHLGGANEGTELFGFVEQLKNFMAQTKEALDSLPKTKLGNIVLNFASASIMRGTAQVGQEWNDAKVQLTARMVPGTPYGGANLWNVVGVVNNGILTVEGHGGGFVSGHVLSVDYLLMR